MKMTKRRQKQELKGNLAASYGGKIWSLSHTKVERLNKHLRISFENTEQLHFRSKDYVSRPRDSPCI